MEKKRESCAVFKIDARVSGGQQNKYLKMTRKNKDKIFSKFKKIFPSI